MDELLIRIIATKLDWTENEVRGLIQLIRFRSVVGAQAGDEGKGKVTADLAEQCNKEQNKELVICASGSGGANAGHTVIDRNGKRHNTNILPAGLLYADYIYMGADKLYNMSSFRKEIERITTSTSEKDCLISMKDLLSRLYIDNLGKLTFSTAIVDERINEFVKSRTRNGVVGTTGQGISTTISQFAVKCPIEIITAFIAFKNNSLDEYFDDYYTVSRTQSIVRQYVEMMLVSNMAPVILNGKSLVVDKTNSNVEEQSNQIFTLMKEIDKENLLWFFNLFAKNICPHTTLRDILRNIVRENKRAYFILEVVQANSLSSENGLLNSTTSSVLNPDLLMLSSLKFCDFTSLQLAGCDVKNIEVFKLIQSTVGNHINPSKIKNYASLLKDKFTNNNDPDGSIARFKNKYPYLGDYARLAYDVLNDLNQKSRKEGKSEIGPEIFITNENFDESCLLSHYYGEKGTTTGRVRELSWFDLVRIKSCTFNQTNRYCALTRLDAYNLFKVFKVCIGYEINGEKYMYTDMKDGTKVFTSYKNFSKKELLSATPIYHEFNTWEGEFDFTQIKSYEEFPIEARKIIEYISKDCGEVIAINLSAEKSLLFE